LAVVILCCRSL